MGAEGGGDPGNKFSLDPTFPNDKLSAKGGGIWGASLASVCYPARVMHEKNQHDKLQNLSLSGF